MIRTFRRRKTWCETSCNSPEIMRPIRQWCRWESPSTYRSRDSSRARSNAASKRHATADPIPSLRSSSKLAEDNSARLLNRLARIVATRSSVIVLRSSVFMVTMEQTQRRIRIKSGSQSRSMPSGTMGGGWEACLKFRPSLSRAIRPVEALFSRRPPASWLGGAR